MLRLFFLVLALLGATPALALEDLSGRGSPKMFRPTVEDITVQGRLDTAGIVARSAGRGLTSYKPVWAYFPAYDLIRYQNLMELTTSHDGDSWESPLGVEMISQTGFLKDWTAGATVSVGDNLTATPGNPEAYLYRVLRAGTLGSASPTAGPGSAPFSDGTAQLQWINFTNLAAKIGLTNTTVVRGNAGSTWGNNFNFIIDPLNNKPRFLTGTEIDFSNHSGYDCNLFEGSTCNGITMFMMGRNRSTSAISIGAPGVTGGATAAEWGLYLNGRLARDAAIEVNTLGGRVGLGFGRYKGIINGAEFSDATIQDDSTSTVGLHLRGSYANSAINLESATVSNVGVAVPSAIRVKAGQAVCFDSSDRCVFYDAATQRLTYQRADVRLFSIDGDGNVRARGSVTGNTTP